MLDGGSDLQGKGRSGGYAPDSQKLHLPMIHQGAAPKSDFALTELLRPLVEKSSGRTGTHTNKQIFDLVATLPLTLTLALNV